MNEPRKQLTEKEKYEFWQQVYKYVYLSFEISVIVVSFLADISLKIINSNSWRQHQNMKKHKKF